MNKIKKSAKNNILLFNTHKGFKRVDVKELLFIEALGRYSNLVFFDETRITLTKNLLEFERILSNKFIRCHKTYLVNSNHITGFDDETRELILSGNFSVPVSARKKIVVQKFIMHNQC